MATHSYQEAIDRLNSLQSNAATLEMVRASGGRSSEFAIPEMLEYLKRIGYTPKDLNALNVIHITGTKGKGSTSAFTESIIRHTKPEWKTGLYTSPHLVAVRERIRINGSPISEADFTTFFFQVWERLEKNTERHFPSTSLMPGYFRFLTLLAFHVFTELKVDATILEVGVGGTYDSTNIVPKPVVTGITALGIDHVNVLGKTLPMIAWQKGGIFKEGVPAFSVNQPEDGLEVLRNRATELKASAFSVVPLIPGLSAVRLGLAGQHQLQNATLAVQLSTSFLRYFGASIDDPLRSPIVTGLEKTRWPGRCQSVADPQASTTTWYLDGAHTIESLDCCAQWFVSPGVGLAEGESVKRSIRVLIFNCTSGRSGSSFLGTIYSKISSQLKLHGRQEDVNTFFDHVIFCANVTYSSGNFKGDLTTLAIPDDDLATLRTQNQLGEAWAALIPSFPAANIHVRPSIEHAVSDIRAIAAHANGPVQVLTTGSLHLVGGLIEVAGLASVAL